MTTRKADTMTLAAARLGVPINHVKFAKKRGCEAFSGGRVDLDALRVWLDANEALVASEMPHDLETAKVRLIVARIGLAEHELATRRREYVKRADAEQTFRHAAMTTRAVLQRKLETELPPKLSGLGAIAIAEHMAVVVDDICRQLNGGETYATTETTTEPCGMENPQPSGMPTPHLEHLAPSLATDSKGGDE